jgi:transcriptional regulator with XRE-family HTH domain
VREVQAEKTTRGKGIMLPNLKRERHRAGLTLRELEDLSGVPNSRISLLENGRSGAQGRTVRRLAEALGVTPKDLVG